jgi:lariat debranching enzyme
VDLLLICGDFESIEQESDLQNIAVPDKYKHMNTFHHYVTGEKVAPVLTVFIGGNHEASNVLQSLYYGGFVAPNIYFLGFAGAVDFGFLRLCGVSGISNDAHFRDGHYERPPYDSSALRSIYHIRELEIYRMSHLRETESFKGAHSQTTTATIATTATTATTVSCPRVNIMMSHDWPRHIWQYGDCQGLLRKKPGLTDDVLASNLGQCAAVGSAMPAATALLVLRATTMSSSPRWVPWESSAPPPPPPPPPPAPLQQAQSRG